MKAIPLFASFQARTRYSLPPDAWLLSAIHCPFGQSQRRRDAAAMAIPNGAPIRVRRLPAKYAKREPTLPMMADQLDSVPLDHPTSSTLSRSGFATGKAP